MKDNANKINKSHKSSIGNKIIVRGLTIITVICVFIISSNVSDASYNDNMPVKVESSITSNSKFVHSDNGILKSGTMEYLINNVEHQKDENNPLLGKDSEYIVITTKVKNNGNKAEVFDAFDMILQATVKGDKKNIRNISDKTIYNILSGSESNIKLVYVVPNDSTDIHIISEKNDKINLEVN